MIYRGTGFLAVVWFGSSSTPSHPSPFDKLDRRLTGRLRKRDNLMMGDGEWEWARPNHTTARKPGPLKIIQYSMRASQAGLHLHWHYQPPLKALPSFQSMQRNEVLQIPLVPLTSPTGPDWGLVYLNLSSAVVLLRLKPNPKKNMVHGTLCRSWL